MKLTRLLKLLPSCLFLALALTAAAQNGLTRLGEFKVNANTAGDQKSSTVAALPDGGFLITWCTEGTGPGAGVFAQRYTAAGSPLGAEVRVNVSNTNVSYTRPNAAADGTGRFVVVWEAQTLGTPNHRLMGRRFDALGNPLAGEFEVQASSARNKELPSIAMHADGRFVIVWTIFGENGESGGNILGQRYSNTGVPQGGEIRPNAIIDGSQLAARVDMNATGDFVVAWHGKNGTGGLDTVWFRRFSADGTPKDAMEVSTDQALAGTQSFASVTVAEDGSFIVTWNGQRVSDGGASVDGRRFTVDGNPAGPTFAINDFTSGIQGGTSAAFEPDGGFVVVWTSVNVDGNGTGISVRRFDATGTPLASELGQEFVANGFAIGDQFATQADGSVATDAAGNFVVVWQSQDQDGDAGGIFADKFFLNGQPMPVDEFRVNTRTTGDQTSPALAMNASGLAVVVWQSPDGGQRGIFGQRYDALGQRVGSELYVNTNDPNANNDQYSPVVGIDDDGNFAIAWVNVTQNNATTIFAKLFNPDGTTRKEVFPVNTIQVVSSSSAFQYAPSLAMRGDGAFVITWASIGRDGDRGGIAAQRFDALGNPIGTEFVVNSTAVGEQVDPAVAMSDSGDFVIAWMSDETGNDPLNDVRARRYSFSTGIGGNELAVNTFVAGQQARPAVSMDGSGKFFVAWTSDQPQDLDGFTAVGRRFDVTDAPITGEFFLNTSATRDQQTPSVALTPSGAAIAVWVSNHTSQGQDIYGQRYGTPGPNYPKVGGEIAVNTYRTGQQFFRSYGQHVAVDSLGNYFVVWQSENQDGSSAGIYGTKVTVSEAPTVTTVPLVTGDVAGTVAILRGSVDPNGESCTVAFDFDDDPAFGSPGTVPVTGSFLGITPQDFTVEISGLTKGITYYYRAKVTFGVQTILGDALTFETANALPVAQDDTIFVPGRQVTFTPQDNDTDLDQDSATLVPVDFPASLIDENSDSLGTLSLVPGTNQLSFKATDRFVDSATFTYFAQDGDGAKSELPAKVSLVRFGAVSGTYEGLVSGDGGSGSLSLTVNGAAGAFTGALLFNGVRFGFDGAFGPDGTFVDALDGAGLGFFLKIGSDGSITGELRDATEVVVAAVELDLIDGGAGDGFTPETGSYTTFLELPEDTEEALAPSGGGEAALRPRGSETASLPDGTGFFFINVAKSKKHQGRFAGRLPDGTKLSAGAGLSKKRRYLISKQLYKTGKKQFGGSIVGRPQFEGDSTNQLNTQLVWTKDPRPEAAFRSRFGTRADTRPDDFFYPQGFSNLQVLMAAIRFGKVAQPITFDQVLNPNGRMDFKRGGLATEPFVTMSVNRQNRAAIIADADALAPKVKIKSFSPFFRGSFMHPVTGEKTKYSGIFRQKQSASDESSGRAFFRSKEDDGFGNLRGVTGKIILKPL